MSLHRAARPLAIFAVGSAIAASAWLVAGAGEKPSQTAPASGAQTVPASADVSARARAIILAPHEGSEPIDEQIRRMQQRIAASPNTELSLERLGRLFIAKARLSNDPGFYKLAEQCALSLESTQPANPEALLLRGHALAAMHQFHEAETIARRLVGAREYVLDHALLGDALMEQGRLDEAVAAYQQMVDLKPGLQAYTRIAHLRWLTGDLEGAGEMMEWAIESATERAAEPAAWATTRLAAYRLQEGDFAAVHRLATRALELVPDYAPALLMRGRVLLAEGKAGEAAAPLQLAVERNPLPEPQWALADALREAGENARAETIDQQLEARGAGSDPRTFSLYLATRRARPAEALRLAQRELAERRDIFTHDAVAWAHWANGDVAQALFSIEQALREGTQDARLFLHAGVISAASGQMEAGRDWLQKSKALGALLLPSERALLAQHLAALEGGATSSTPDSLTSHQTAKNNDQTPK